LSLCDVVPRTTVNAMLYQWMHQLLYVSFYKYIIMVCTLKNWWWWGIVQCVETFTKNAPHPPPKNHMHYSWDSMLSTSTSPKFYPPKFRNWPNFSPRMTSACLYPQVHDFLIRCYYQLIQVVRHIHFTWKKF
jgi:hypothetical protein